MLGCECICWGDVSEFYPLEPEPFSLPSPLPKWPQGKGFGAGTIRLGEIEVVKITEFERVWSCSPSHAKMHGVTFYRPLGIPDGFHCLGYYCQPNDKPLRGYVLVARETIDHSHDTAISSAAMKRPLNYKLILKAYSDQNGPGYFWQPNAPVGYRAMGILVTDGPDEPGVDEVRCVREDLTEDCEPCDLMFNLQPKKAQYPFRIWSTRPCKRGMWATGVSVGTFFCDSFFDMEEQLDIACLKNVDCSLHGMPDLDQINALIRHYGPTVFFHPDEVYMPSSVQWFFKNGALLYDYGKDRGEPIEPDGSNLPRGGCNDGEFWIDLPDEEAARDRVRDGDLESAELYVHVKPALGGTFTDLVMWVFCPFNGPATLKIGLMTVPMARIGQHVGDWEHFTLRVSNFTGELWGAYFSQHSGGGWVDASGLEYIEGNRPMVFSSKSGHASFPHPGTYLQGSSRLGIGLRNDCARSEFYVDSSERYRIVAAEYLGDGAVAEPRWLQYMREWGPTVTYDSRSEVDRIINLLPFFVRFSVENLFDLFPTELYGEEGPTGPKEKDNWVGDERD